jgi:hypothetical protein
MPELHKGKHDANKRYDRGKDAEDQGSIRIIGVVSRS